MAEEEERWQRLIDGLRSGDQQTVRDFCTQYGESLHQLAEKRLTGSLRRRVAIAIGDIADFLAGKL